MLIPTPHVNDCRMFNFPDSTPLVVMRNYKYSQVMYENSTNLDLLMIFMIFVSLLFHNLLL